MRRGAALSLGKRWAGYTTLTATVLLTACAGKASRSAPEDLRGYVLDQPLTKPAITLTATDGRPFDFRKATDGLLTLVFFGYTNCPDVCPVHMSNLAGVLPTLPPRVAERTRVVFITTDPRRDTPARLRAWLDHFDPGFIGLTGDSSRIAQAAQAMQLNPAIIERAAPGDTGYAVGHSALVVAFTPDNMGRVVYPFGTRQEDWAHDLPKLADADWSPE